MLERILVGVDGSTQAACAEAWAARLARDLGAWLVVASVWRPSRPELSEAEARVERDRALHLLQDSWARPAHLGTGPVESVLLDGDSPDALLDAADRIDADLVVVGTRGRGGFAGLRVGSFSDYLAHRTTRPLAVIPADAKPGVSRIVVGLDGAEGYPWVVGLCAGLAEPLGADVIAVYADRPHRTWLSPPPEDWNAQVLTALDGWAAPLHVAGVTVDKRLVETDHAADALLEVAGEVNADAIVIGTRDFSGYRLLRLGGVTMALLHHGDRPVIIVPPPE